MGAWRLTQRKKVGTNSKRHVVRDGFGCPTPVSITAGHASDTLGARALCLPSVGGSPIGATALAGLAGSRGTWSSAHAFLAGRPTANPRAVKIAENAGGTGPR